MNITEVLSWIQGGESSKVQFKENVTNAVSIAQEMVAFANSKGGHLIVGVNDKTGEIVGLSFSEIQRINNLLTTAANEHVKSPIVIESENINIEGLQIIIVTIQEGTDKPYTDKDGLIFVKNGADKRKVVSKEEISRLLQSSGNLYAEKMLIPHSSIKQLEWITFKEFYEKKYKEEIENEAFAQKVENVYLGENGNINLAANLLFGKKPQLLSPDFYITAIWFYGNEVSGNQYLSSENIGGNLADMFKAAQKFIIACLRKVQNGRDFNTLGELEVPELVINELLVNALIHRDYFIKDSIKVFIFDNRIEIKSPGKLPNSLTSAQIQKGISRRRNSLLASFAFDVLPYRGAGSGILRSIQAYPHLEFINDTEMEEFTAIIYRQKNL